MVILNDWDKCPVFILENFGTGELRALCVATWDTIVFTRVLSFFFLLSFFFFSSPFSAAAYSKLMEIKVVGISLSYRKKVGKTLGVPPGTLYTPHLALIWG